MTNLNGVKVIDVEDALKLLENAVKLKGEDYVYVNDDGKIASDRGMVLCHYVHTSEGKYVPGCIVGHVMRELGVGWRTLLNEELNDSTSLVDAVNYDPDCDIEITYEASLRLRTAQWMQDVGETWGEALKAARKNR